MIDKDTAVKTCRRFTNLHDQSGYNYRFGEIADLIESISRQAELGEAVGNVLDKLPHADPASSEHERALIYNYYYPCSPEIVKHWASRQFKRDICQKCIWINVCRLRAGGGQP